MPIDFVRLNDLRTVKYEEEYCTYAEYIGSVSLTVKDKMLYEMASMHANNMLCNQKAKEFMQKCSLDNIKCFAAIYGYDERLCKADAIRILRSRYDTADMYGKAAVFQCIRRLAFHLEFGLVKQICNEECLSMIIGEYAFKNGIEADFIDSVRGFEPYVFLGYTQLNGLLLDTFEPCFARLIGRCAEILDVLDYSNDRVVDAVMRIPGKNEAFVYIMGNGLVQRGMLVGIACRLEIDCTVLACNGFFDNVMHEDGVEFLRTRSASDAIKVGMERCRSEKVCRMVCHAMKGRECEFMSHKNVVDLLLVMVYHDCRVVFGDELQRLQECAEKQFLMLRERQADWRCSVDVDRATGELRLAGAERGVAREDVECTCTESQNDQCICNSVLGGFEFLNRKSISKRCMQQYIDEICKSDGTEECIDNQSFVRYVRKRLGFRCMAKSCVHPTFGQILRLPNAYFCDALGMYLNVFLNLVQEFNNALVPSSRKRDSAVKAIVSSGYKELFVEYLVTKDRYFRIAVDFDKWFDKMSVQYKRMYVEDHLSVFVKHFEHVLAVFGEDACLLMPAVDSLRIIGIPDKQIRNMKDRLQEARGIDLMDNSASTDEAAEECIHAEMCDGDDEEKENTELAGSVCGKIDGKDTNDCSNGYESAKRKKESNVYNDEVDVETISYSDMNGRVGMVCNEVSMRMASGKGIERASMVTAALVGNDDVMDKVVSVVYDANRCGRRFLNVVEFIVRVLACSKRELRIFPWINKIAKRHVEESEGCMVVYFVAMKARIEEINAIVEEYRDRAIDLICSALCNRISMARECVNGYVKVGDAVEQPVVNKKDEVRIETMFVGEESGWRPRMEDTVNALVHSDKEFKQYVGLRCALALGIWIDVHKHLDSGSDRIVETVLKQLRKEDVTKTVNTKLMDILCRRGKLDAVGKECLRLVDVDDLDTDDAGRINDMFFVDPIGYLDILPRMVERGYELSNMVFVELIKQLKRCNVDKVTTDAMNVLRSAKYTEEMVFESIISIESARLDSKMFLIEKILASGIELNVSMFLRLCVHIGNEDNYQVLEGLLNVLRVGGIKSSDIINKWKGKKSLEKLMTRIYPLWMEDVNYYKGLLKKIKDDTSEIRFIAGFYKNELRALHM
ncbi:hypothetical protein HK407_03g05320 [Ordospora pajunii]|uniref:uncharacterized protein n=1 Tax=Ordospora pajunii TaxID=3039483 RepID=UPI0029528949|nr:uncharacterized protein HK407_03g05320 [Ordospora pajunii]KAH9411782.1 hypothetical protein HK407_03g05320 [Ordospora pajunii]